MKVITAIYLHCRPDLRDEWLTGVDVDADVEESLVRRSSHLLVRQLTAPRQPHEQALRALVRFFNTKHYGAYAPHLHRRSSSANHPPPDFGQAPPPSPGGTHHYADNDVFPPRRSMSSFDVDSSFRAAYGHDTSEDLGEYDADELLFGQGDPDGEMDPTSSRAAWDRLGDLLGHYDDDISDSESVGSYGFLGFGDGEDSSEGSVSDFDMDEEVCDEQKNRDEWEHIRFVFLPAFSLVLHSDAASSAPRRSPLSKKNATQPRRALLVLAAEDRARDQSLLRSDQFSSTETMIRERLRRRRMDRYPLSRMPDQQSMRSS